MFFPKTDGLLSLRAIFTIIYYRESHSILSVSEKNIISRMMRLVLRGYDVSSSYLVMNYEVSSETSTFAESWPNGLSREYGSCTDLDILCFDGLVLEYYLSIKSQYFIGPIPSSVHCFSLINSLILFILPIPLTTLHWIWVIF